MITGCYANLNERFSLDAPTVKVQNWLEKHPTVHKVIIFSWHLFRALRMAAFMYFLPFTPVINIALSLGVSLAYRLIVEGNCAYKFALSEWVGGTALEMGLPTIAKIINGVAVSALSSTIAIVPIALWGIGAGVIASQEVKNQRKCGSKVTEPNKGCCKTNVVLKI